MYVITAPRVYVQQGLPPVLVEPVYPGAGAESQSYRCVEIPDACTMYSRPQLVWLQTTTDRIQGYEEVPPMTHDGPFWQILVDTKAFHGGEHEGEPPIILRQVEDGPDGYVRTRLPKQFVRRVEIHGPSAVVSNPDLSAPSPHVWVETKGPITVS